MILVETMVEDAGAIIEEQRLRSERATRSRSAGDYPYTGKIAIRMNIILKLT